MTTLSRLRIARPRDLTFVVHLAKKFSDELGFLPGAAILRRIEQSNVLIAVENGEPAGYLLGATELKNARHIRPIFQAAIAMDAQRRHHGLQLLQVLEERARAARQTMLQCYCRRELVANEFWRAAGFIAVATRDVNARRGEPCILWRRPLVISSAESLAQIPANERHQAAGGRCVGRFAWDKLPQILPTSTADISHELERLNLLA